MDSGIYHVTTTGNTEPAAEGVKDLMVRSLKTENRSLSLPSTDVADSSSLPDPQPGDTIGIHEISEADLSDLITHDGLIVGFLVGRFVGAIVGFRVGNSVGVIVGFFVG